MINIIAVSNSVKKLFVNKYKAQAKKITVLPSGSSIKINIKQNFCYNKRFKIGYFGSISPSKGVHTIIKLSKIDQNNDYYIFGGLKSEIDTLRKKNFNKNLYLNENIPYINLPKAMLKMDILTIPYTKNNENIYEWKKNIAIIKNNKVKNYIMNKNNFTLSKQFDHSIRVKKYIT